MNFPGKTYKAKFPNLSTVIDGVYFLQGLQELTEEDHERWKFFEWFITKLKGKYRLEDHIPLLRTCNATKCETFHAELTLHDALRGSKNVDDRMLDEMRDRNAKGTPSAKDVTLAYDGSKNNRTLNQETIMAASLDNSLLDALGFIMHGEHPEIFVKLAEDKGLGNISVHNILREVDFRVFRKFSNITSLKQCTPFMSASEETDVRAFINTMY